jgi:hypothetical protein
VLFESFVNLIFDGAGFDFEIFFQSLLLLAFTQPDLDMRTAR